MKATIAKIIMMAITFAIFASTTSYAQTDKEKEDMKMNKQEMFEKMKSAKIAFITERLNLTPAEAEKFWPLYNEYETRMSEVTKDLFRRFEERPEKPQELSDDEADKIIQQRFNEEKALLDLKKEYYGKYKSILTPSRILTLYEAENNFRRHMLENMDRNRSERDMRQGGTGKPEHARTHSR